MELSLELVTLFEEPKDTFRQRPSLDPIPTTGNSYVNDVPLAELSARKLALYLDGLRFSPRHCDGSNRRVQLQEVLLDFMISEREAVLDEREEERHESGETIVRYHWTLPPNVCLFCSSLKHETASCEVRVPTISYKYWMQEDIDELVKAFAARGGTWDNVVFEENNWNEGFPQLGQLLGSEQFVTKALTFRSNECEDMTTLVAIADGIAANPHIQQLTLEYETIPAKTLSAITRVVRQHQKLQNLQLFGLSPLTVNDLIELRKALQENMSIRDLRLCSTSEDWLRAEMYDSSLFDMASDLLTAISSLVSQNYLFASDQAVASVRLLCCARTIFFNTAFDRPQLPTELWLVVLDMAAVEDLSQCETRKILQFAGTLRTLKPILTKKRYLQYVFVKEELTHVEYIC